MEAPGIRLLVDSGRVIIQPAMKRLPNIMRGRLGMRQTMLGIIIMNSGLNGSSGNYSINVIAYYDAGQDVKEGYIYVIDNKAPVIKWVNFSSSFVDGDVFVLKAGLEEESMIKGEVRINNGNESRKLELKQLYSLPEKTAVGVDFYLSPGDYTFNFTACDELNNCADSNNYNFSVSSCLNDKRVLFVGKELMDGFKEDYCVAEYEPELAGIPLEYLNKFDAVVWSTGNSINSIDDNDANTLREYIKNDVGVFLEGADIGFTHGDDEFMREVAHGVLMQDMSFMGMAENNSEVYLINKKNHPVMERLGDMIGFDTRASSYPDSIIPVNGGVSVASWNKEDDAIIVSEDGARTIFVPFSLSALSEGDRGRLIREGVEWLTDETENDFKDLRVEHGYLVEGDNLFNISFNSNINETAGLKIKVDDAEDDIEINSLAGENLYLYKFSR